MANAPHDRSVLRGQRAGLHQPPFEQNRLRAVELAQRARIPQGHAAGRGANGVQRLWPHALQHEHALFLAARPNARIDRATHEHERHAGGSKRRRE
jgi:hypothetical protein